jgi:hypothetical protein
MCNKLIHILRINDIEFTP